ncbi:MAG: hypothetical protein ABI400_12440, partial [Lacisediminihabitans sp.]
MTDEDHGTPFTRRQVLIGSGGVVVVGAAAFIVATRLGDSGGAQSGSASSPDSSSSPIPSGRSSRPGRMLQATAFCGIYYGHPTITLSGSSNAMNQFQLGLPIGATTWQALDARGRRVGQGTMTASDTAVTVCETGVWRGGVDAVPGHYTVLTDAGELGVVTGNIVICPPTKLHVPQEQPGLGAWLAVAPDRDLYSYVPGQIESLVAMIDTDPYFTGPQDAARPRSVWIAPSPQATSPTRSPTAKEWGELASAMKAAGHTGAYYECPTNEPENGGWAMRDLISYWKDCRGAVRAADPSAHVMGFDSGGIMDQTSLAAVDEFLASCHVDAMTDHMENSHQNLSNIVAFRQFFGAMKKRFEASGRASLDLWLTETGINGGGYGVLQPRRDARQRSVLRLVFESFGWPKEHSYDFRVFDAFGSGLTTFMVDRQNGDSTGNLRAGAYALHVMSEALYGTTCTPDNPPSTLRFGSSGGLGDSLFAGLHYRGKERDVVVLATNGMEQATVDLQVSAVGEVEVWDGMGVRST